MPVRQRKDVCYYNNTRNYSYYSQFISDNRLMEKAKRSQWVHALALNKDESINKYLLGIIVKYEESGIQSQTHLDLNPD